MNMNLEAVYENGVFRPLQPVQLPEHQRVLVTVPADEVAESQEQVDFALPADRWEEFCAALDAPPKNIPALRRLLTGTQ
ncbi:MAG TPA: antitoxin AF2212-like protein [Gemmataceae bacterium]|nr:antitoxin AF2212-like protein [Gemmataceae bacterium]